MSAKKQKKFQMGDRVIHSHRGSGTFECYKNVRYFCMVKFDDDGQSSEVTTALVRPLNPIQPPKV